MRSGWNKIGPAAAAVCGLALAFVLPSFVEVFVLVDLTAYVVMAILALSLALVWGYAGILCFGQSAFFGIGGYAYALGVLKSWREHYPIVSRYHCADAICRSARLFFILWKGKRHLLRCHNALCFSNPFQSRQLNVGY